MAAFDNKYSDKDVPLCPRCNKQVHSRLDDTIVTKVIVGTVNVQHIYHLQCYNWIVLDIGEKLR